MSFDPDTFLDTVVDAELDTAFVPVPEGEYNAVIEDINIKVTSSGYTILNVKWAIDDANVAEATGRDTNTVMQGIFLDMTNSGNLDTSKGKNIQLGKLRDAFNQNDSSSSLRQLVGNAGVILVTHRETDDGSIFPQVKSVTAA